MPRRSRPTAARVRLDPTRALVFFKLGRAYREIGERHRAVYAFEQASLRAGTGNVLQRRADWEVEKLTFTIVPESGVCGRRRARGRCAPGSPSADPSFAGRHPPDRLVGAARHPLRSRSATRSACAGSRRTATSCRTRAAERPRKPYVARCLEFDAPGARPAGTWTVEARIDDDVIDSQRFTRDGRLSLSRAGAAFRARSRPRRRAARAGGSDATQRAPCARAPDARRAAPATRACPG